MSITKRVSFDKRLNELEVFLIENKKKPTAKTNKSLKIWLDAQVKESNKNVSKRDAVRGLLNKYNLIGKIDGLNNWEDTYFLFKKYIEENKTDKITEKESKIIFGMSLKSWLDQARTNPDRRLILEKLYKKHNLKLIKKPLSHLEEFKKIFAFSYEYKISHSLLRSIQVGKTQYPQWVSAIKKRYKNGTLSSQTISTLKTNRIEEMFSGEFYFDIEHLKIFHQLNSDMELEKSAKNHFPFLIIKKELGSEKVTYQLSVTKITTAENIIQNNIEDCQFELCIDVRKSIANLKRNLSKLSVNDLNVLKELEDRIKIGSSKTVSNADPSNIFPDIH